MLGKFRFAFVVVTIGGTLLSIEVESQSPVDDSPSCESFTLNEAVNLIREDLKGVKHVCESNEQQCTPTECSTPKEALISSLLSDCVPVLIQQNVDGSDCFNRSWEEFKVGFNDKRGNYWLGNDLLSQLTQQGRYKLRFDLQLTINHSWYWAEYSTFIVKDETHNYKLHVSGFSGNTGFDALAYHNGMMFTTFDRNNDEFINGVYNDNCAVRKGGGFWYHSCAYCDVNTVRGHGDTFRWRRVGGQLLLQKSRMWLTCQ